MPSPSTHNPATTTTRTDHVLVARQPIFDRKRELFGYELLFRDANPDQSGLAGDDVDAGDAATATTINTSLNVVGLGALTGGKKALINITRKVLLDEMYTILPPDLVVMELLETVEPDEDVIAACRKLKAAGYELALDDFVFHPRFQPLLDMTDILKVDFLLSTPEQRLEIATKFRGKMRLLAEKVESHEDVAEGMKLGYSYFQGYFYCKPQLMSSRKVPADKRNYLRFLQEVNREDASFEKLEEVVKQEMSLSVKLLRYLNSAAFGLRTQVTSIKHAMSMLGINPLRKWASLVAMTSMGEQGGGPVVTTCLGRARFCELVGKNMPKAPLEMHRFLVGLLSGIDAMLSCHMSDVLEQLTLATAVKEALMGQKTQLRDVLDLSIAYEQADWQRVTGLSTTLGIANSVIASAGKEAARWADEVSVV